MHGAKNMSMKKSDSGSFWATTIQPFKILSYVLSRGNHGMFILNTEFHQIKTTTFFIKSTVSVSGHILFILTAKQLVASHAVNRWNWWRSDNTDLRRIQSAQFVVNNKCNKSQSMLGSELTVSLWAPALCVRWWGGFMYGDHGGVTGGAELLHAVFFHAG